MSEYILTADGQLYHADYYNEELYHYGVKGMKWGHRKARQYYEKGQKLRNRAAKYDTSGYGVQSKSLQKKMNSNLRKAEKYERKAEKAELKSNLKDARKELKKANKAERAAANRLANAMGTRRADKFAANYEKVKTAQETARSGYENSKNAYNKLKQERMDSLVSKSSNAINKGKNTVDSLVSKSSSAIANTIAKVKSN